LSHNGSKPDIEDLKEKGDVEGLIKALQYKKESTEYEDYEVRRDAAEALGDFEEEKVIKALTHAFKDVEDVRFHVARNLGKFGKTAVPFLIETLQDPDESMRRDAAWMLGNIGDERAIPPLTEALKDKDEEVRFHVARNLGKFEEPAVPYLLDALKDPDEHVRRYAAWILGVIGDDRAVPALENALNDPSDYVRKGVEQALRRFG